MMNRRELAKGLGMGAGGLMLAGAVGAAAPKGGPASPLSNVMSPPGPWTGFNTLRRAGGQLHYATMGPDDSGKPPVVLLHKLGGWLSDWRFVAPTLAEGRRVIAIDLPGHGGSRWDGPAPYIQTLAETAALIVGMMDELAIRRIDLLGTSLGGCVSAVLAAMYPERVRRVALISCALYPARTLAEVRVAVDEKQKTMFDASGMPVPSTPQQLIDVFGMVHADELAREGNLSRIAAAHWLQCSERGVGTTDLHMALRRIEAPTLLMLAQFDKAYVKFRPFAEAALRNGRTEVIPNSGAFVIQDNPAATAPVLKAFIEKGW